MDDENCTVAVRVADDDGSTDIATMDISVDNVDPIIENIDDAFIMEGETFSLVGRFTDPGSDQWQAKVDYQDGTRLPLTITDKAFSAGHIFADNGDYRVSVTVTDDE